MLGADGIQDGDKVVLTEPLPTPPQTALEALAPGPAEDAERQFSERLAEAGLVLPRCLPASPAVDFVPVRVCGKPVSATVIAERR